MLLAGIILLKLKRRDMRSLAVLLTFVIFPIGGFLIYWLIEIYSEKNNHEQPIENPDDFNQEMPVFELIEPLDIRTETNIASVEENLLIADYEKRREVVLNILKEGMETSRTGYMDMALRNEDSETVHFAASGILHAKRKLDASLNICSELYKNDPSDMTIAYTYADLLFQYLTTVKLDRVDRLFYIHENIHVLEKIVKKSGQAKSTPLFRLIDLLLEIEDFHRVYHYCDELGDKLADSEEKYLTLLKCFFIMKDKARFEQTFNRFRNSEIYFSSETIQVIRLWLESLSHIKTSYE